MTIFYCILGILYFCGQQVTLMLLYILYESPTVQKELEINLSNTPKWTLRLISFFWPIVMCVNLIGKGMLW